MKKNPKTNNQNQLSTYMVLCGLGVHANNFKTTIAVFQHNKANKKQHSCFETVSVCSDPPQHRFSHVFQQKKQLIQYPIIEPTSPANLVTGNNN